MIALSRASTIILRRVHTSELERLLKVSFNVCDIRLTRGGGCLPSRVGVSRLPIQFTSTRRISPSGCCHPTQPTLPIRPRRKRCVTPNLACLALLLRTEPPTSSTNQRNYLPPCFPPCRIARSLQAMRCAVLTLEWCTDGRMCSLWFGARTDAVSTRGHPCAGRRHDVHHRAGEQPDANADPCDLSHPIRRLPAHAAAVAPRQQAAGHA